MGFDGDGTCGRGHNDGEREEYDERQTFHGEADPLQDGLEAGRTPPPAWWLRPWLAQTEHEACTTYE